MKNTFKPGDKVKVARVAWVDFLSQGSVHVVYDTRVVDGYEYVYLSKEDFDSHDGWDVDGFVRYEEYKEKEQFVQKIDKIDMNKKYRRVKSLEPVRVICTDRKDSQLPCIGLYLSSKNDEGVLYFDHHGIDYYGNQSIEEIIVDWKKVKVDTLIWVNSKPRYFAWAENNKVAYYMGGTTSKTNTSSLVWVHESSCYLEEPTMKMGYPD